MRSGQMWEMRAKVLLIGFISFGYLFLAQFANAQELKKIGFIAPLTGPGAPYGNSVRNGLELALSEIKGPHVTLITEDDQFSPSKTVAAFQKLVEVDHVDLVISVGSAPTAAIAPIAQERNVPLIGWASDDKVSTGRPFVIRSWMSGLDEGKKAAEGALKKGYKKTAVLITLSDYPVSVRDGFIKSFPKDRLISSDATLSQEQDFRSIIGKMKGQSVDSVYLCMYPGPLALFAKQLKQLGMHPKLFGCENLHDKTEIKNAQGTLEGAWFVTAAVSDDFQKKYIARYHDDSVISGAAIHYDILRLLEEFSLRPWKDGELQKLLLGAGPRKGAIGDYQVVEENNDRYFKISLIEKEIAGDGFKERE